MKTERKIRKEIKRKDLKLTSILNEMNLLDEYSDKFIELDHESDILYSRIEELEWVLN